MVHPGKRGHRIVAVLQFKFDESYDKQIMSVGGWIATEQEWKKLESTWQRRIDFENAHSRHDQQITRFHASHMNCKDGEYKNWDKEMCLQLSKKLIDMLGKRKMGAIAVACDMDAIQTVFSKGDPETMKRRTYVLCMKQVMVHVGIVMQEIFPNDTVLLIHDHGNWDDAVLQAYNLMVDEPDWPRRDVFEGLVMKTGGNCVGLQAADMIAYEVFKGVKAKTFSGDAEMRGAMKNLASQAPIRAQWIDLPAAQALYRVMKESGKYPNLDEQGIA
jgi:hypothetical protein